VRTIVRARLVFYLNRFLATWKWKQSPKEIVKAAGDAILKSDFIVNHKGIPPTLPYQKYLPKYSTLSCEVKLRSVENSEEKPQP